MKWREIKVPDNSAVLSQAVSAQQAQMPIIAAKEASLDDTSGKVHVPLPENGTAQEEFADPTFRINKLIAADQELTHVAPNQAVRVAVTLMLAHDYSQLPVMTSPRDVKGIISWTSIGSRLAVGKNGKCVQDLMEREYHEVFADSSFFQAVRTIVRHQYVLVRGSDDRIVGIVTATDLSLQFQQLSEPFLRLAEIESHIRRLLNNNFSSEELASLRDHLNPAREISGVADLTFGDYVHLLESNDRWQKLELPIDRAVFRSELDKVREIRNDVMHFDPVGIDAESLKRLQSFSQFLRRLHTIGIA
jgi:predicted transcriptional regulator